MDNWVEAAFIIIKMVEEFSSDLQICGESIASFVIYAQN